MSKSERSRKQKAGSRTKQMRNLLVIPCFLPLVFCLLLFASCAKPLAEGRISATEPVVRKVYADPNNIYYATKWAFEECGYPKGTENLMDGILDTKWVPVSPASHYMKLFKSKEYGVTGAYYKMIVKIVPVDAGVSEVSAYTEVNSIPLNVKSTGDMERKILEKIAEYARGYNITVTNLGVEE